MVGHKQGVHVILMAVQRLIAAVPPDHDLIIAQFQAGSRNQDVLVLQVDSHGLTIHLHDSVKLIEIALKVELQVAFTAPLEVQRLEKRDRLIHLGGN